MHPETEQATTTVQTPQGAIVVTQTFSITREKRSGLNQVVGKNLLSVEFHADGDWLTDAMAEELAAYMRGGYTTTAPSWMIQA